MVRAGAGRVRVRDGAKVKRLEIQTATLLILTLCLGAFFSLAGCRQEPAQRAVAPLPTGPLPASMKGYELYSWRSGKAWRYTLVTGSNRLKTVAEVTSGESKIDGEWVKIMVGGMTELQAVLSLLPAEATVFWAAPNLPSGLVMPWVRLALPPESTIEAVKLYCIQQGIQLEVLG
jgi:hypothetical protein